MKFSALSVIAFTFFCITFLSSCQVIEGIFKAGVGVGVFVVVAIIALVVFIAMRFGKKNS
jgi:hypothetical protein